MGPLSYWPDVLAVLGVFVFIMFLLCVAGSAAHDTCHGKADEAACYAEASAKLERGMLFGLVLGLVVTK
jgi:hypothetical protein